MSPGLSQKELPCCPVFPGPWDSVCVFKALSQWPCYIQEWNSESESAVAHLRSLGLGFLDGPRIFLEAGAQGEGGLARRFASIFILPLGRLKLHVNICRINLTTHKCITAGVRSKSHLLRTTPQIQGSSQPCLVFHAWCL